MRNICFICLLFIIVSACSSGQKATKGNDPSQDASPVQENTESVATGWVDNDTYTVHVTGDTLDDARDKARYQILKDIVNVRVHNNSRYTDITKIQVEFEKPLKNGVIIKKNELSGGMEIWFQITDKGLKEKFQRK